MAKKDRLSGNEAVAVAMRQVNPDVMPAFPITPSTELPQYFSSYVANGQVDTEFIPVESEHSAMGACIGSEAAGARTITATSSAGFAFMWELLYVAASNRLPIVLALVNRALSGPININCDHSDGMGARDSGWIQLYAEDNQEAYDNYIQAFRIGEHEDVQLPVMVCQDGFITSHGVQNIELLEDKEVKKFVGQYKPARALLNPGTSFAVGPYSVSDHYFEAKRAQAEALKHSKKVIKDVAIEYKKLSGRGFTWFEEYKMKDAEYCMIIMGSAAGTGKDAVDALREKGVKAGLIKIRMFRPFPGKEIANAISKCKVVACMDRTESYNLQSGPIGADVKTALYNEGAKVKVLNYVYGLGGRDVTVKSLSSVFKDMEKVQKNNKLGNPYRYLSVRG